MWNVMGASVRGPQHRRAGLPNQDSWAGGVRRRDSFIVVCDGLGSRLHSAAGSRAACASVAEATRIWSALPDAPVDLLLRTIHALWNLRTHATGRDASATTCLFAAVTRDGRLVLAQLGDGLVLMKKGTEQVVLEPGDDRFGNATTGLGIAADLQAWRTHVEHLGSGSVAVLLATDGIADDLRQDQRQAFLDHLLTRHGPMPRPLRNRSITAELHRWPTPHHLDDKTLAVLWNPLPEEAA